ncbi:hypothetical protein AC249_AIPGENE23185 [Exaiptasia diaphana]|nr:hypothetical protein AC249_AIPGENE23185 [Exaiptasia diaphana]
MIGAEVDEFEVEVEARDDIGELRTEVDALKAELKALKESSQQKRGNACHKMVKIDHNCSKAVHKAYRELSKDGNFGWNFEEGFHSPGNKSISRKLSREARGLSVDVAWTKSTINDSMHQYWKSLRDDKTRRQNQKFQLHRTGLRQQQRLKRILILVASEGAVREGNTSKQSKPTILVICPLRSLICDQLKEVQDLGITASSLPEASTEDINQGKYQIIYSSAEHATDQKFLQSTLKTGPFHDSMVALVVDEAHMLETWTGRRYFEKSAYV